MPRSAAAYSTLTTTALAMSIGSIMVAPGTRSRTSDKERSGGSTPAVQNLSRHPDLRRRRVPPGGHSGVRDSQAQCEIADPHHFPGRDRITHAEAWPTRIRVPAPTSSPPPFLAPACSGSSHRLDAVWRRLPGDQGTLRDAVSSPCPAPRRLRSRPPLPSLFALDRCGTQAPSRCCRRDCPVAARRRWSWWRSRQEGTDGPGSDGWQLYRLGPFASSQRSPSGAPGQRSPTPSVPQPRSLRCSKRAPAPPSGGGGATRPGERTRASRSHVVHSDMVIIATLTQT